MNTRDTAQGIDKQTALVLDLTYLCNFRCRYCQWGDPETPGRTHRSIDALRIDPDTLDAIGVERVVLSGGEPELHPRFEELIGYYAGHVDDVITITNGLRMTPRRVEELIERGLSGLSFSLDALDPDVALRTRSMSPAQLDRVVGHLREAAARNCGAETQLEVGLNAVVSSANCSVVHVREVLEFADEQRLGFVKFQPLFDDGYVSRNAPDLKLDLSHADALQRIAEYIGARPDGMTPTNGAHFWHTLAALQRGATLAGHSCGIDTRQSILMRGELKFCFWVDRPIYGKASAKLDLDEVEDARQRFRQAKANCDTGPHCFCLQSLNHRWQTDEKD